MHGRLLSRFTYANLMATIAVFLALGGSAFAAGTLITGRDVKDSSLTGRDVKNGSLTKVDFKAGQLPLAGNGAKGDTGARGDKGDTGSVDTSGFYSKSDSDARYLALGGKAADASKLDGMSPSALAKSGNYDYQDGSWFWTGAKNCDTIAAGFGTPQVTVDVGPSGLVAVYAEAQIQDFGGTEMRVQLYEPTSLTSCPTIVRGNSATNGSVETKRTSGNGDGGTTGAGTPVIMRVAPGTRTFSLRYGSTSDAAFGGNVSKRLLWVQPL